MPVGIFILDFESTFRWIQQMVDKCQHNHDNIITLVIRSHGCNWPVRSTCSLCKLTECQPFKCDILSDSEKRLSKNTETSDEQRASDRRRGDTDKLFKDQDQNRKLFRTPIWRRSNSSWYFSTE